MWSAAELARLRKRAWSRGNAGGAWRRGKSRVVGMWGFLAPLPRRPPAPQNENARAKKTLGREAF